MQSRRTFPRSVITTILVNGREVVQKFSIVVPPNEQHRISAEASRRTERRVAGSARFARGGGGMNRFANPVRGGKNDDRRALHHGRETARVLSGSVSWAASSSRCEIE